MTEYKDSVPDPIDRAFEFARQHPDKGLVLFKAIANHSSLFCGTCSDIVDKIIEDFISSLKE